jgi:hypothetical protein
MRFLKSIGRSVLSGPKWIAHPFKLCLNRYESIRGPVYARQHHKESLQRGRSITRGLEQIRQRWPDLQSNAQQSPVFILSAGWRSGSTLMQRLVMSEQSILVWGEPYSHARLISHLADGISAITDTWPEDEWFIDRYDLDKLDSMFVANMYPPIHDMQQACLAYFTAMFESPAEQRGFGRWGLKDVRLSIEDAHFIKWLFPDAKFIFLCRNPYDAYRSYRVDRSWYFEWPDKPVFTAAEFGRNWNELASGFYQGAEELGGMFIRYEDLVSGAIDYESLEAYLNIKIDVALLEKKVGSHERSSDKLPSCELKQLRHEVHRLADVLDYRYDPR